MSAEIPIPRFDKVGFGQSIAASSFLKNIQARKREEEAVGLPRFLKLRFLDELNRL